MKLLLLLLLLSVVVLFQRFVVAVIVLLLKESEKKIVSIKLFVFLPFLKTGKKFVSMSSSHTEIAALDGSLSSL